MTRRIVIRSRHLLFVFCAALLLPPVLHAQPCAATYPGNGNAATLNPPAGYRIRALRTEPFTGRTLALLENCSNASLPWLARLVDAPAVAKSAAMHGAPTHNGAPIVKAGTSVRVRATSGAIAAFTTGVALESAPAGTTVRVQLQNALHPGSPGSVVQAIAIAPGEVEWQW